LGGGCAKKKKRGEEGQLDAGACSLEQLPGDAAASSPPQRTTGESRGEGSVVTGVTPGRARSGRRGRLLHPPPATSWLGARESCCLRLPAARERKGEWGRAPPSPVSRRAT
jgi:hypothetical protein